MRRSPIYDPPEYREWRPDDRLGREYRDRIRRDANRARLVAGLGRERLLGLYLDLLITRFQDIQLKRWVRQGVLSKAWLGTGEEATTVGATAAMNPELDIVSPMIRNAGACHMMGMPLHATFAGYLGTTQSRSRGRDLHVGDVEAGVIPPISHMGSTVTIVAGAALAFRNRNEERVALGWVGDGAVRTAASHEGLRVASRLRVPAIFVIQNNQAALGTRVGDQDSERLRDLALGHGIPVADCDGNNVLDVFACAALARRRCVSGKGPLAIVARTFRMGGHATHDEREARELFDPETFREWGRRDPIGLYEQYLLGEGMPEEALMRIEHEALAGVDAAANKALDGQDPGPRPSSAAYAGFTQGDTLHALRRRLEGPIKMSDAGETANRPDGAE